MKGVITPQECKARLLDGFDQKLFDALNDLIVSNFASSYISLDELQEKFYQLPGISEEMADSFIKNLPWLVEDNWIFSVRREGFHFAPKSNNK